MAGQFVLGKGSSTVSPAKIVLGVLTGLAALLLVYLVLGRVLILLSRAQPVVEGLAPSHCEQFIAIAKAAYGDNWKVRLDPRDTTCAGEIAAEWERQRIPRVVPQDSLTPVPDPQPPVLVPAETRPAPATRCLNIVSLAKAKYGAEWRTKLEGAEAQACAAEAGPGE